MRATELISCQGCLLHNAAGATDLCGPTQSATPASEHFLCSYAAYSQHLDRAMIRSMAIQTVTVGLYMQFSNALALVMAVDDRLLQFHGGRLRFQEGEEAWIPAVKCQSAGQALQSIRVAFNSPAVLSGWAAGNPCTSNWTGVTCSTVNGAPRVTTL